MGLALGLPVIAIGVVILIKTSRQIWFAFRSTGWPTTTGKVTHSYIGPAGPRGDDASAVTIKYAYQVAGQSFNASPLRFGQLRQPMSGSAEAGRAISRRYPVGLAVTVSYDPNDPSRAVLHPGISATPLLVFLTSLLFIVSGVIAVAFI